MSTIRLGNALIDRVAEQSLPVSLGLLTDDGEFLSRRIAQLPDGFLDEESVTFQFSSHSWVVRVDGLTVLVDPCTGNGREGRGLYFDGLNVPFLERLAQSGVSVDAVDVVFCTHLHHDHCGWNTVQVDGAWVPTFPNATYLLVDEEYRRWDTSSSDVHPNEFNPNTFDECVRPIVDAGLAKVVSAPYALSSGLTIEPAPGHTVGHALMRLESEGMFAYFSGDAFHHPVQLTRPELHLPGCDDLATAIVTRQDLVRRALDEGAFLFPAHFPAPHYGHLSIDGGEVCFVPGGAPDADHEQAVCRRSGVNATD
ncbi:MBL fold metallo-hydrolase [Rhodococcus sp. ACS1]|uniref:MBL fold metallo-hydrolase n=1 Tax=Rhodococcus sp. ACS1 TaxID=2028570 RepID=UPI000BB16139|nr:MBL fold metallo-hydrolase [Rhodococcus sp. ACS1]PBC47998.1 MBL fold metallo-hydrolase [Rhodococcus sp. ACS1]